jgi:hypothetical protein
MIKNQNWKCLLGWILTGFNKEFYRLKVAYFLIFNDFIDVCYPLTIFSLEFKRIAHFRKNPIAHSYHLTTFYFVFKGIITLKTD